ncbi:MAG: hypothetical protein MR809_09870 [Rikenellaceae bacterium]|nr:hypothetical protein [Rikenellaceae bacterium]
MKKWFTIAASMIAAVSVLSCTKIFPGDDDPKVPITGDEDIVNLSAAGYKYGYAVYYGQAWDIESTDYADWILYVSKTAFDINDEDFMSNGDYAKIEILTEKSETTAVPAGTYTCMTTGDESEFVPGALIYGMTDDEGYPTDGTWFFQGDDWAGAAGGSIAVKSVKGTAYTIDVDLVDEDYGYSVTGSFTANLEYIDATAPAAQARKAKSSLSKKALVKKLQNRKKAAASHPTKAVRDNKFRPRFAK